MARSMRRALVSACFASSIQWIHSAFIRGVRDSKVAPAFPAPLSAFARSAGVFASFFGFDFTSFPAS